MWNDPIVEETRRLRDEYSAKHNYSIHEMVEDLNQWEKQGCPMPADIESNEIKPLVAASSKIKSQ
uniref:hypothetical protein n=1 Tax=Candidatus Electronema sp. TaxID=2698783 RepID=UPI0040571CC6